MRAGHDALRDALHPDVRAWFAGAFAAPTPAQAAAVPAVAAGEHVLVSSPTGSGKTLAAFLAVLSRLHAQADAGTLATGVHAVYVSPLRALAHDVARNLEAPLAGIAAIRGGASPVRVALRTGETSRAARDRHAREPPHVLVTTPESLALVVAATRMRPHLATARVVIVDELHALAGTKRGAHLALTLERLDEAAGAPLTRVGLSATVRPLDEAAAFLTGGRGARVVEVAPEGDVDLDVEAVHPDGLAARDEDVAQAVRARLDAILAASRTTLVFTNTRQHAETLALDLEARWRDHASEGASVDPAYGSGADPALVAPHHGSMSREARLVVEERLKRGDLRAVVASSSLELGVHVDHADHVVLLGSPRSAARALQRVGRSGHGVGEQSRGTLLVGEPDEAAEALAVAALARRREVEPLRVPAGGLDVLAQHVLGLALDRPRTVDGTWALARRAWPYRDLPRPDVDAVVGHLAAAGLVTRAGDAFEARGPGARWRYATGCGAIPAAGLARVVHGRRFVGEVEEAFAESLQEGDVLRLSGASWRKAGARGGTLLVEPAGLDAPTVPTWRGEGLAASPLVAAETGRILSGHPSEAGRRSGRSGSDVISSQVAAFVAAQSAWGALPSPDVLVVERCLHDSGRRALVFHALLGRRANDALGRALAHASGEEARVVAADHGVALLVPRRVDATAARVRTWLATRVEDALRASLPGSDVFRRRFRHVAERGLLLRRDEPGPAGPQTRADALLARLLRETPDHPLVRETWREVLDDAFDAATAEAFRARVVSGDVAVRVLPRRAAPSPYAACVLAPRGGFVAPWRRAALRDLLERGEAWRAHAQAADAP